MSIKCEQKRNRRQRTRKESHWVWRHKMLCHDCKPLLGNGFLEGAQTYKPRGTGGRDYAADIRKGV